MDKKNELENHLKILLKEKAKLTDNLNLSSENLRQLERKGREKDQLLRCREKDIEELRAGNHHLLERLETMSGSRSLSPSSHLSLLSELEMSGSDQEKQSLFNKQFEIIEETDEDFEFEEVEVEDTAHDAIGDNMKGLRNEVQTE